MVKLVGVLEVCVQEVDGLSGQKHCLIKISDAYEDLNLQELALYFDNLEVELLSKRDKMITIFEACFIVEALREYSFVSLQPQVSHHLVFVRLRRLFNVLSHQYFDCLGLLEIIPCNRVRVIDQQ